MKNKKGLIAFIIGVIGTLVGVAGYFIHKHIIDTNPIFNIQEAERSKFIWITLIVLFLIVQMFGIGGIIREGYTKKPLTKDEELQQAFNDINKSFDELMTSLNQTSITYVAPAVGILLENENGEILLITHNDGKSFGTFNYAVEEEHSLVETLKNNIFGDIGVLLKKLKCLGVFSGKDQIEQMHDNPKDKVKYVTTVFYAKIKSSDLKIKDGNIKKIKFFKKEELPEIYKSDNNWINKWKEDDMKMEIK